MVGDVKLSGQSDRPTILASHHIEPLELDAEDEGRPLYLVLLGGRHLLVTLLALVHVLPLAKVLAAEVARQRGVNVVRLSDEHNRCMLYIVLCNGIKVYLMSNRRSMKCWKVVETYLQRRHVTSCLM